LTGLSQLAPTANSRKSAITDTSTVVVFLDQRYHRTPDRQVWTDGPFPYTFFERYLQVFDRVRVVARVRDALSPSEYWNAAGGPGVDFAPVPYYIGMTQYLAQCRAVRRAAISAIGPTDTVLLRVPGQVATSVEGWLRRRNRPYGVEVVGDPYDAYAPGTTTHALRPLFRHWFRHRMRKQVAGAAAAAYVTRDVLQQRFPAPADAPITHYSSVELSADAFVESARTFDPRTGPLRIITVGSLENLYKGPDTLIDALAQSVANGLDAELRFVGGGKRVASLKQHAHRAGLDNRVHFLGQLPAGVRIREELDRADLFVLPSRAEGLPRALIEAMARALPAIGSDIGGIPELLHPDQLVPAGDVAALAGKLMELANQPDRLAAMSAQNLRKARDYSEDILCERRDQFYERLRSLTARSHS